MRILSVISWLAVLIGMMTCSMTWREKKNNLDKNLSKIILKYRCPWAPFITDTNSDLQCNAMCGNHMAFLPQHQNQLICFTFHQSSHVYENNKRQSTRTGPTCECGLVNKHNQSRNKSCDDIPQKIKALKRNFGSCKRACEHATIFVSRLHAVTTLVWCHPSVDISDYKIYPLKGVIMDKEKYIKEIGVKKRKLSMNACHCGLTENDIEPSVNIPTPSYEIREVWLPPCQSGKQIIKSTESEVSKIHPNTIIDSFGNVQAIKNNRELGGPSATPNTTILQNLENFTTQNQEFIRQEAGIITDSNLNKVISNVSHNVNNFHDNTSQNQELLKNSIGVVRDLNLNEIPKNNSNSTTFLPNLPNFLPNCEDFLRQEAGINADPISISRTSNKGHKTTNYSQKSHNILTNNQEFTFPNEDIFKDLNSISQITKKHAQASNVLHKDSQLKIPGSLGHVSEMSENLNVITETPYKNTKETPPLWKPEITSVTNNQDFARNAAEIIENFSLKCKISERYPNSIQSLGPSIKKKIHAKSKSNLQVLRSIEETLSPSENKFCKTLKLCEGKIKKREKITSSPESRKIQSSHYNSEELSNLIPKNRFPTLETTPEGMSLKRNKKKLSIIENEKRRRKSPEISYGGEKNAINFENQEQRLTFQQENAIDFGNKSQKEKSSQIYYKDEESAANFENPNQKYQLVSSKCEEGSTTLNYPSVIKPIPIFPIATDDEGLRFNLKKNLKGEKIIIRVSGKDTAFKSTQ